MTKKRGASLIILAFSAFALLGICAFALDLGIILNQRYELQKAVESAALISASEFELYESGTDIIPPTAANITNATTGVSARQFLYLKDHNQVITSVTSTPTYQVNTTSKAVRVGQTSTVNTYFLQFLGVRNIRIDATAAAVYNPVTLNGKFPRPTGSIVQGIATVAPIYQDTNIKQPLGGVGANVTVYNQNVDFDNIYGFPDGRALSLGPGGYITIKLPEPIVDGRGFDFAIYERGYAEGYFVYAGIDTDPNDPYVDASHPGAGINWINVSCTGMPLYLNKSGTNSGIGAHRTTVTINGVTSADYKFYGSGYFDLGATCTNIVDGTIYDGATAAGPRISNVKYLKIIDDNAEDGFFIQSNMGLPAAGPTPQGIPALIPGEHSTLTPGADIDAVEAFHHSRLIKTSDYTADADADGIINFLETNIYGAVTPQNMWGYDPNDSLTPLVAGNRKALYKDYFNSAGQPPPVMEIIPP